MLRRLVASAAVAAIAVSGLVTANTVQAVVSNASISPTEWTVGTTNAATLTWTESNAGATTFMVRSPWPWPATYPAGTTDAPITETAQFTNAGTQVTCPTTGIVFESPQFSVTAAPACNYVNAPASNWTGFYISGGTLGISAAPTITVTVPSGLVIAPSAPRNDTWLVGPYSLDYNPATQVEVATAAVATGGVGAVAPTVTIDIDGNGGTCRTQQITGFATTWATAPNASDCYNRANGGALIGFNTSADGSGLAIPPGGNLHLTGDNRLYAIYEVIRAPGAPTGVVAVAGRNVVKVAWKAPADTGSYPISNYLVQASPGGKACITRLVDVTMTECTFTTLEPGTSYTFQATALNGAGWGETSVASAPVAPWNLQLMGVDRSKKLFGLRQAIDVTAMTWGLPRGTPVVVQWQTLRTADATPAESRWERAGTGATGTNGSFRFGKWLPSDATKKPVAVRIALRDPVNDSWVYSHAVTRTAR
jgi:hypothetical protein